jgi:hypothetical protein
MNSYLGPIRRYPWLLALALPVAFVAAMLVVYDVNVDSGGPRITERNQPSYHATVQILVTSNANPYLRAQESPQSQALIDTANYLPFIIESDRVAEIRARQSGRIPGEVTAQALFARLTNRGLNESAIPIIEVTGTAPTGPSAKRLAQGTVAATLTWLAAEQTKANVAPGGRVVIERLRAPTVEVEQQSSKGLAALVFVVVLLGFVALAWMLDRATTPQAAFAGASAPLLDRTSQNGSTAAAEPAALRATAAPTHPVDKPESQTASERRWA